MRKRPNALQEKRIEEVKKTFGSTLFLQPEQIARLRFPDDFESTNWARLSSELVQNGRLALHDLVTLMQLLPETYTAKLLTSDEFGAFIFRMLQHAGAVDKKRPGSKLTPPKGDTTAKTTSDEQAPYSLQLATEMLNVGLAEVIRYMPEEFQESLKMQLYPFLTLVNAIANFSQSSRSRVKTPRFYLSFDLLPSFMSNRHTSTM